MNRTILLTVAALIAVPAAAGPQILPAKGARHLIYDMATGELRSAEGPARIGESVWASTQYPWYYFIQMYYGEGATTLDWGDIAGPQPIGGYSFAYGSHSVLLPERLDVINLFFADDNGFNSENRTFLAGFHIPNLPGADPGGQWHKWVITVDLDAAGLAFTIDGEDLDGDGRMDFSYTYWFTNYTQNNPQYPNNYLGPVIAGDPNAIPPTAPGIEGAFDFFGDPNLNLYWGTYWGDYPFPQFYMELYDSELSCPQAGGSGKRCTADIWPNDGDGIWEVDDGDCLVGLDDLAQLLANYPTPADGNHELGDVWPENGDGIWQDGSDGDGAVDLSDLAELLSQYSDDCR